MFVKDLKELINPVCNATIQAGKLIKKFYKSNDNISLKVDKSPITKADIESNLLIKKSLIKINKKIPILSEEELVEWSIRKNWHTYWLVDPLDGTKEFIKQNDEFTVNIALIENNRPVLGVIYAPIFQVLYFAYKKGGSYKLNIDDNRIINNYFDNGIKIQASTKKKKNFVKVICSRSHPNEEFYKWIKEKVKKYELIRMGSSLKFCKIAEGIADLYPRFKPTSEWDIAAGHIILTEADGKIETINKKEMLYNLKENVINPHFIASSKLEL